jgi:signal transduction histidine kinase
LTFPLRLPQSPGRSSRSAITVRIAQRDEQLHLHIEDDGRGSSGAAPGNGLAGMRERADALGGTMAAASLPGRGYAVSIALPFAGVAP